MPYAPVQQQNQNQNQHQMPPFQPIQSRHDEVNPDLLYQQRLAERTLDGTSSSGPMPLMPAPMMKGAPQMQQPMMQQPMPMQMPMMQQPMQMPMQQPMQMPMQQQSMSMSTGQPNVNPSVIATFLGLDPATQQRFATANPVAYAQICTVIQNQYQQQMQQQHQHQAQPLSPHPEPESESEEIEKGKTRAKTKKSKKSKKSKPTPPPISDSDNLHSSDEELNIKPHNPAQSQHGQGQAQAQTTYLPLDFRTDLNDVEAESKYILSFPRITNVWKIELETCILNRSELLEREPYIYICIDEIHGDYKLNGQNNQSKSVFGKLIQEKTANEYIFYRPENCSKTFNMPHKLEHLTVSFLKYNAETISLSKINIRDMSRSANYTKINTRGSHFLNIGDRINIGYKSSNKITVDMVTIIDVPVRDTFIVEATSKELDAKCTLDKVEIKCSLTFKITY